MIIVHRLLLCVSNLSQALQSNRVELCRPPLQANGLRLVSPMRACTFCVWVRASPENDSAPTVCAAGRPTTVPQPPLLRRRHQERNAASNSSSPWHVSRQDFLSSCRRNLGSKVDPASSKPSHAQHHPMSCILGRVGLHDRSGAESIANTMRVVRASPKLSQTYPNKIDRVSFSNHV